MAEGFRVSMIDECKATFDIGHLLLTLSEVVVTVWGVDRRRIAGCQVV
jgi:hypothetical protein